LKILIPIYNESESVVDCLDKVNSQIKKLDSYDIDVICINDGSEDNSLDLLEPFKNQITILSSDVNFGLSEVFNSVIQYTKEKNYNYLVIFDADLQYLIEDLETLLLKINETKADILIGSRNFRSKNHFKVLKKYLQIIGSKAISFILGKQIKESQSRLRPIGTGDIYTSPPPLKGLVPVLSEPFNSWKENICLVPSTFKNSLKDTYQGISPALTLQIVSSDYNESLKIINKPVTSIELETWEAIYKRWKEWLLDLENSNYTINFEGPTDYIVWGKKESTAKNKKIGLSLSIYYSNKIVERKINSIREKLKQDLANSKGHEKRKLDVQELLIKNISEYITMQNKAKSLLTLPSPTKKQIIEAQSLFKEAKRKKRSRESIVNRINFHKKKLSEIECFESFLDSFIYEENEDNKNKLESIIELKEEVEEYICIKKNNSKFKLKRKKETSLHIKEIQSPSGLKIQIGGNNRQNELISLKKGKKGDLWFHAQETPGSHVVLKSSNGLFDDKDIELAADLASFFSRSRGNKLTPIIMVPIENLKRISGSLPGTVSHRGGKVLWGKAERAAKYFHQK